MLKREEIFSRVKMVISDSIGILSSEINLESNLSSDLGADSIDHIELIINIEKEFSLLIPDEIGGNIQTVQDIVNYIEDKIIH
jgi:acyl carrier protein